MKYLLVVPSDINLDTARWAPTLGVVADSPDSPVTDIFNVPGYEEGDPDKARKWITDRDLTVKQTLISVGIRGLGYIAKEDGFVIASLKGPLAEEDQFPWPELNPPDPADEDAPPYTDEDFARDEQDGLSS